MKTTGIKDGIMEAKKFFKDLEDAGYEKGDKIRCGDVSFHGKDDWVYDGAELVSFTRVGILKIVKKEFVNIRGHRTIIVTPEEIVEGKVSGWIYTRNVYKVICDNFEDWLKDYVLA